jgi:hypothetical protein
MIINVAAAHGQTKSVKATPKYDTIIRKHVEKSLVKFEDQREAGEYGFVWVKNMQQKEFNVYAFGIDWKNSD